MGSGGTITFGNMHRTVKPDVYLTALAAYLATENRELPFPKAILSPQTQSAPG
jgi:hypothetical protein